MAFNMKDMKIFYKVLILIVILILFFLYINYDNLNKNYIPSIKKNIFDSENRSTTTKFSTNILNYGHRKSEDNLINIEKNKINRLFEILLDKEKDFSLVFEELNVVSFKNLITQKGSTHLELYQKEVNKYLKIENENIVVTDDFINYLVYQSEKYLQFNSMRTNITRNNVTKVELKLILYHLIILFNIQFEIINLG